MLVLIVSSCKNMLEKCQTVISSKDSVVIDSFIHKVNCSDFCEAYDQNSHQISELVIREFEKDSSSLFLANIFNEFRLDTFKYNKEYDCQNEIESYLHNVHIEDQEFRIGSLDSLGRQNQMLNDKRNRVKIVELLDRFSHEELTKKVREKYLHIIELVSIHSIDNEEFTMRVLDEMHVSAKKGYISKYNLLPIIDRHYTYKRGKSVFGMYSKELLGYETRIEIAKKYNLEDKITE